MYFTMSDANSWPAAIAAGLGPFNKFVSVSEENECIPEGKVPWVHQPRPRTSAETIHAIHVRHHPPGFFHRRGSFRGSPKALGVRARRARPCSFRSIFPALH